MAGYSRVSSSSVRSSSMSGAKSHDDVMDDVEVIGSHVRHYQVYRGMSPNTSNRLERRISELEESLQIERDARIRWEKENSELSFQLEGFSERLEEAETISKAQSDACRSKDQELLRIKKDFELLNQQHETSEASQRKRHLEATNDMSQQIEHCKKEKHKSDVIRQQLLTEIDSCSLALEATSKAKVQAESKVEGLEDQLRRVQIQYDELVHQTQDFNGLRARLSQENIELHRQVQDLDASNASLSKLKSTLQLQLDEATANEEEESRIKNQLINQVTNLQIEFDNVSASLDEQIDIGTSLRTQLQHVQADYQQLKAKYDSEIIMISQELDDCKRKNGARVAELENAVEQARFRTTKLEKEKMQIQIQLRDATNDLDIANNGISELSQRLKQTEHVAIELRARLDDVSNELQRISGENQRLQADLSLVRQTADELQKKIDSFARDNKQLSDSLRDAHNQNKDLIRQSHDFQANRIELESERNILADQLGETQEALGGVQSRFDTVSSTLVQLKADAEKRLKEKDDEIDAIRKSSSRGLDELQRINIEIETKYKSEIHRFKRQQETDLEEYEGQLESLKRTNGELARANRSMASRIKDVEVALDDERRKGEDVKQSALMLERKRIQLQTELDNIRALLETAERARKQATNELSDATQRVGELTASLTNVVNDRRQLETERTSLLASLEEAVHGRQSAEEQAGRSQVELARLTEELHCEMENYRQADGARRTMEVENRELAVRVEQVELFAIKEGRKLITNLEARLVELESELSAEQRRSRQFQADSRKLQRVVIELKTQSEEDRRQVAERNEVNNSLQVKIKTLKRQLAEAEEMVTLTLNKYRKTHQLLEECERGGGGGGHVGTESTLMIGGTRGTQRNSMSVVREVTRVVRI